MTFCLVVENLRGESKGYLLFIGPEMIRSIISARRMRVRAGIREKADTNKILCGILLLIQEKFIYFCYNGNKRWNKVKKYDENC